jgi:nitrite reductase/ring-hydroxylating ferredoxin subunit/uncharacterized membrane protein
MSVWLDSVTGVLERSRGLDRLGRRLGVAFSNVVRPGITRDLLAGTWLAHPLHPMLTDVTIGTWSSALMLDFLGGERAQEASDALIGLGALAAIPTAVTGLSDLSDVVRKEDRSVGTAHALGNAAALVLYSLSYVARKRGRRRTGVGLSTLGAGLMTGAGFLGGHLAYRRGVGVDQNVFDREIGEWTAVLDEAELIEAKPRRATVSGTDVLLVREEGTIRAMANRCSHRGGPLHKGSFDGGAVTCPWHLSTFSLEDGRVLRGPATAPQPTYDVRLVSGKIEIRARR